MKRLSKAQKLFRGGIVLAIMTVALVTAVFATANPGFSSSYPNVDKSTLEPKIKIVCTTRGHEHKDLSLTYRNPDWEVNKPYVLYSLFVNDGDVAEYIGQFDSQLVKDGDSSGQAYNSYGNHEFVDFQVGTLYVERHNCSDGKQLDVEIKHEPTCVDTGEKTLTCRVCGFEHTVTIPASGHTFSEPERKEPTCTEAGYEKGVCTVCEAGYVENTIPALGHIIVTGTKGPTCTEPGQKTEKCDRDGCNYHKTEPIPDSPALGHDFVNGECSRCPQKEPPTPSNVEESSDKQTSEDGDSSSDSQTPGDGDSSSDSQTPEEEKGPDDSTASKPETKPEPEPETKPEPETTPSTDPVPDAITPSEGEPESIAMVMGGLSGAYRFNAKLSGASAVLAAADSALLRASRNVSADVSNLKGHFGFRGGQDTIIIRVKCPSAGSYKVVHEYYTLEAYKDENGVIQTKEHFDGASSITTVTPDTADLEKEFYANGVKPEPEYYGTEYQHQPNESAYGLMTGEKAYEKHSTMSYVKATADGDQIIILKYVRDAVPQYKYVHEYYVNKIVPKDDPAYRDNFEGRSDVETREVPIAGEKYTTTDVEKVKDFKGNTYTYVPEEDAYGKWSFGVVYTADDDMDCATAKVNGNDIIILRYVRKPGAGSYKVIHEYYKDSVSPENLEGKSDIYTVELEEEEFKKQLEYKASGVTKEPDYNGVTYTYQPQSDAYGKMDSGKETYQPNSGMTYVKATENGEQIIILRYVRSGLGSYKVVHEYYKDSVAPENLEGRTGIETIGGLPLDGKTYSASGIAWKTGFNGRTYTHVSDVYGVMTSGAGQYQAEDTMSSVVATESGQQIIILQYVYTPDPPDEPDLPDPNDPDSPDEITITEEGVPKTYIKVWDPENEEFIYIPDDEVPLWDATPQTNDSSHTALWAGLCAVSLAGMIVLGRKKDDQA